MGKKAKRRKQEQKRLAKLNEKDSVNHSNNKGKNMRVQSGYQSVCRYGACKNTTGGSIFCSIEHYELYIKERNEDVIKNPIENYTERKIGYNNYRYNGYNEYRNVKREKFEKTDHERYVDSLRETEKNFENGSRTMDEIIAEVFPGIAPKAKLNLSDGDWKYTDYAFSPEDDSKELKDVEIRYVKILGYDHFAKVFKVQYRSNEYEIDPIYLYDKRLHSFVTNNHDLDKARLWQKAYIETKVDIKA